MEEALATTYLAQHHKKVVEALAQDYSLMHLNQRRRERKGGVGVLPSISKNKKASIWGWFMITVAVFVIAILYMILTKPVIEIQKATNDTLNDSDYATTYNQVITVWKYWPIVMLLGLIILGIMMSLKKEPYTGYEY